MSARTLQKLASVSTSVTKLVTTLAVVGVTQFTVTSTAMGQTKAPGPAVSGTDDKVDVTDLEKKYWASKDTDFSVVQNRLYTKANRFALSLQYGTLINDQWSDAPTLSGSLGYYFSERFGIEGHYQQTNSVDNKALSNLKAQSGTANHGKIKGYQGLSVNWVPFYAKMSVLNGAIMYFDMAVSPTVGMTTYDQQIVTGNQTKSAPTVGIDVTQSFFFSKHAAVRIDYKNRWFQEEIIRYSTGASLNTEMSQTSILLFGLTLYY